MGAYCGLQTYDGVMRTAYGEHCEDYAMATEKPSASNWMILIYIVLALWIGSEFVGFIMKKVTAFEVVTKDNRRFHCSKWGADYHMAYTIDNQLAYCREIVSAK